MAALFSKPPKPQPQPPAPTVDEAQMRIDQTRRSRRKRGRASTMLVGQEGNVSTAAKALTGN